MPETRHTRTGTLTSEGCKMVRDVFARKAADPDVLFNVNRQAWQAGAVFTIVDFLPADENEQISEGYAYRHNDPLNGCIVPLAAFSLT